MTIQMPDSVTPGNMPMGFPAYLGYVDGLFRTAPRLAELFPGARIVTLTVTGATLVADGCDCETDDLMPLTAAHWLDQKIQAGARRPVLYASRDTVPVVLGALPLDIKRQQIRILSAHYGEGEHICSPSACGASFQADGTQWTDEFPGVGGAAIDMSLLADDFFGTPHLNWTETIVQELPVRKQGDLGPSVRTVQGLCCARGHAVTIDGVFGPATAQAVKNVQATARITQDGVVGPQTWPALLGV